MRDIFSRKSFHKCVVYVRLAPFQLVVPRRNFETQDDILPIYSAAATATAPPPFHPGAKEPPYMREE